MLTIPIIFWKIYLLTNFRIFCKGVHHLFFRKMEKIKNFQVWMSIDWKLSNELNEIWHSSFWLLFLFWQPKNWVFLAKKGLQFLWKMRDLNFCQKWDIFFRFFNRSLAKSRRTSKRPTVLISWLEMLTIPITLREIYFLTNSSIFCKGVLIYFFEKWKK